MAEREIESVIGDNTKVRLGLLIGMVGFLVAGTWWAASVSNKLDSLVDNQKQNTALTASHVNEITSIKSRLDLMDAMGTTRLQKDEEKLDALAKRLDKLEDEVDQITPR